MYFSKISTSVDCLLLSSMLPLGAELLEGLRSNADLITNFKYYFNGLVLLAGSSQNEGHLALASAVTSWLNLCAGFMEGRKWEKQDSLVPAANLLQYLAHLSTAVQFSTNRASCSERISIANEGDILVRVRGWIDLVCCVRGGGSLCVV